MISFLFLLMLAALVSVMIGRHRVSYVFFATALVLSIYWYFYHATSQLNIIL